MSIFEKDGARYVVRAGARSTGGPTVDYYKAGSRSIDLKIRLRQPQLMTIQRFITDNSEYARLKARLLEIFNPARRLPDQMFLEEFEHFRFLEFDLMLTEDFWHVLGKLADAFGDSEIVFTAHEPDPDAYYFTHFCRYGMIKFNRTDSPLDYYGALRAEPSESPADALLYVANVASWFGTSKQWAFWGERDFGIGVAAARSASLPWPEVERMKWFGIEDALSGLVSANFRNGLVPDEFSEKLRRNFCR